MFCRETNAVQLFLTRNESIIFAAFKYEVWLRRLRFYLISRVVQYSLHLLLEFVSLASFRLLSILSLIVVNANRPFGGSCLLTQKHPHRDLWLSSQLTHITSSPRVRLRFIKAGAAEPCAAFKLCTENDALRIFYGCPPFYHSSLDCLL